MNTLKPPSNGPLYSNAVIGTLAVDGYIWYILEVGGAAGVAAPIPLLSLPNVTDHGQCTNFILFNVAL